MTLLHITCPNCQAAYKVMGPADIDLDAREHQTWPAVCPWCAFIFRWDRYEGTRLFTDAELREVLEFNQAINYVRHQTILDCLEYQPKFTKGTA